MKNWKCLPYYEFAEFNQYLPNSILRGRGSYLEVRGLKFSIVPPVIMLYVLNVIIHSYYEIKPYPNKKVWELTHSLSHGLRGA